MAVETLAQFQPEVAVYLREIYQLSPVAVAWIGWLWRKLKEERNQVDGIPIDQLEVDHRLPVYKGGTDDPDNLQALSRVEHALKHHRAAKEETDKKNRHREYGATGMIVSRMTPEEYKEFLNRLKEE